MELWIARDKNGELYLHMDKPEIIENCFFSNYQAYRINGELFPQVTWENSPQRVRIELMEEKK